MTISSELISEIRKNYRLSWHGFHGVSHWSRVRDIGLKLSPKTGANPRVVELFSFLHDSQRVEDGFDRDHGLRASRFAMLLQQKGIIHLDRNELEILCYACEHHSSGETQGDVTVMTCWDADRLDLGRCNILPTPDKLCTPAAKHPQMIQWAYQRTRGLDGFIK